MPTKLQMKFEEAAATGPADVVARKMGICPATFHNIRIGAVVPKQLRIIEGINNYFKEKIL